MVWLLPVSATPGDGWERPPYPWPRDALESLEQRFPPPVGFGRLHQEERSFGAWLRGVPLRPRGSSVRLFDGTPKRRQVHAAVVDIDVGERDLQQCADAVIRLRAEYLFALGCERAIAFDFTSGDRARWTDWADGLRPQVTGNRVRWSPNAAANPSYENFRRYLDTVFMYAGTYSLRRELEPVADPKRLRPGDVFVEGGFPGHAVLVVDVAVRVDSRGEEDRRFLLAQSFMPAQEMQVLLRPGHPQDPWYPAAASGSLITPEWHFTLADLYRFPDSRCD